MATIFTHTERYRTAERITKLELSNAACRNFISLMMPRLNEMLRVNICALQVISSRMYVYTRLKRTRVWTRIHARAPDPQIVYDRAILARGASLYLVAWTSLSLLIHSLFSGLTSGPCHTIASFEPRLAFLLSPLCPLSSSSALRLSACFFHSRAIALWTTGCAWRFLSSTFSLGKPQVAAYYWFSVILPVQM